MKFIFLTAFLLLASDAFSSATPSASSPNWKITPGVLCQQSDADFAHLYYPEQIARCNRNIGQQEKANVAKKYGNIPKSEWSKYEFDHLIPLCAGGANSEENLWPEPIAEAKKKDVLEINICMEMKAGTLKQADAVQKVHEWFRNNVPTVVATQAQPPVITTTSNNMYSCDEPFHLSVEKALHIDFHSLADRKIDQVKITFSEDGEHSEIENSKTRVLSGKLSSAKKAPLTDMILYTLKSDQDRFDIYLPSENLGSDTFDAYLKISFDDSFPRLTRMECHLN